MGIVEAEHITEVFTGFGERGVAAENVAGVVVEAAREYGRYPLDEKMVKEYRNRNYIEKIKGKNG